MNMLKKIILSILGIVFFAGALLPAYWFCYDLFVEEFFDIQSLILFFVAFSITLACLLNVIDLEKILANRLAKKENKE